MDISFTIRGKPTAQARHRTFMIKTKTGKDLRINTDPHKKAKDDFLALAHENAPDKPLKGPLLVMMKCVFPRPKKHFYTGKRADVMREDAPLFCPSKKNDFDNLAKFVCDSLNHIFYEDDGQIVVGGPVLKMYGEVPRTEFTLRTIDEARFSAMSDYEPIEDIIYTALRTM
jgi:Holliday junction resolvase RusA-like endonuclease